jgi:hypothetical protein
MEGRFISKDPAGIKGGINLYSYVQNNPINKTDPSGLCDDCPNGIWSGAGFNIGGVFVSGGVFTGIYRVSCWSSSKVCWIMVTCSGTGIGLGGGISVESIWVNNAKSCSNLSGKSGYVTGFGGVGVIGVGGSASPGSSPTASGGVGVGAGGGYLAGRCTTSLLRCN